MKLGPDFEKTSELSKPSKGYLYQLYAYIRPGLKKQTSTSPQGPMAHLPAELLLHILKFAQKTNPFAFFLRQVNHLWKAVDDYLLFHKLNKKIGLLSLYRSQGLLDRLMGRTQVTQHSILSSEGKDALFEKQKRKMNYFLKNKNKILQNSEKNKEVKKALRLLEKVAKENRIDTIFLRDKALNYLNETIIAQKIKKCIEQRIDTLDCTDLCLTDFPGSIIANPIFSEFWKNLTVLDLSGFGLEMLPDNIGELERLCHLFLYNNQLSVLPRRFSELHSLKYLYLQNNKFTIFPTILNNLNTLHTINLSDNQLNSFPSMIHLRGVQELDFSGNPLFDYVSPPERSLLHRQAAYAIKAPLPLPAKTSLSYTGTPGNFSKKATV